MVISRRHFFVARPPRAWCRWAEFLPHFSAAPRSPQIRSRARRRDEFS